MSVYYGWTPVDYTGWILTFIGIGLAVKWARRGPMVVDDPDRPEPLLPAPGDGAIPGPARPVGNGAGGGGPGPPGPAAPPGPPGSRRDAPVEPQPVPVSDHGA